MDRSLIRWAGILLFLFPALTLCGQKKGPIELPSPDGNLVLIVEMSDGLKWSVRLDGREVIAPSEMALILDDVRLPDPGSRIRSMEMDKIDHSFEALNYKKAEIRDHCSQLSLDFGDGLKIVFRVYDDAVAYRFVTRFYHEIVVTDELANFNFTRDHDVWIPYVQDYSGGFIYCSSFESPYSNEKISEFRADSLAFLPAMVELGDGKKTVILEADLEDYPGMFLKRNESGLGYQGVFAPYPLEIERFGRLLLPVQRAGYIAQVSGNRAFPWRAVAFARQDRELLGNDLVQKLAAPSRIEDPSWIRPGQATWEWWNDWNISGVDFEAGINTKTYLHYIDFAAENGIPYLLMDEGWSVRGDLLRIHPEVDLQRIISYGKEKMVGVVLWAQLDQLMANPEEIFSHYAGMGVQGFKIDFLNRDDQPAVASTYFLAGLAARYKLIVDFHGIHKPAGLQRTYPNVLGYEGVKGLEYLKWTREDVTGYEVTIPYIRMLAGPMDYTPGAMRNATRRSYYPVGSNPMSQGTRCRQLAMYVIYEAPFQMLADNPTIYREEQECTDFIVRVPVVFDRTVPLDGKVGEYVALARKKEDTWYAGAMTDREPRDLVLDLSFLDDGMYRAVIFRDGINAHRQASDYVKEILEVTRGERLEIHLSRGGGWAARFERIK